MRVFVLNATAGGLEVAKIFAKGHELSGYIGLTPDRDNHDAAGFVDGRDFCAEANIAYHEVSSYALSNAADRALLESLDIDVLLVTGWQRLVPEPVIRSCGSVLGVHGSPFGITRGRGRSPQNWALILGSATFELSIFRILPGIDDGEVLATQSFAYNLRDDIRTSYLKVSYITGRMLLSLAAEGRLAAAGAPQDEASARYLPQRLPEDGQIDWRLPAAAIVDLVRALTRPYPGAFTVHGGGRVMIWDALAFEAGDAFAEFDPGALIHHYGSGELLVRCGDGAVIVRDHDYEGGGSAPRVAFESADHEAQRAGIVERHRRKYPHLPVAERLFGGPGPDGR